MAERKPTIEMYWTDYRGNKVTRDIHCVIDLRDYKDRPGFALLMVAANVESLSIEDILRALELMGNENDMRSRSWIARRRWLFSAPDKVHAIGMRANADGKQARAVAIMQANPTMSVRALARLLQKNGINRSSEWVRKHRCDN